MELSLVNVMDLQEEERPKGDRETMVTVVYAARIPYTELKNATLRVTI